jgi:hypothetical protein
MSRDSGFWERLVCLSIAFYAFFGLGGIIFVATLTGVFESILHQRSKHTTAAAPAQESSVTQPTSQETCAHPIVEDLLAPQAVTQTTSIPSSQQVQQLTREQDTSATKEPTSDQKPQQQQQQQQQQNIKITGQFDLYEWTFENDLDLGVNHATGKAAISSKPELVARMLNSKLRIRIPVDKLKVWAFSNKNCWTREPLDPLLHTSSSPEQLFPNPTLFDVAELSLVITFEGQLFRLGSCLYADKNDIRALYQRVCR